MEIFGRKLDNFDKYLWRFNGILIFFIVLVGFFGAMGIVYEVLTKPTRTRTTADVVKVDKVEKKNTHLRLGYFEVLPGTNYLLASLNTKEVGMDLSFVKDYQKRHSSGKTKNYFLFNAFTLEENWVWPESKYLIWSTRNINVRNKAEDTRTVGLLFEYIKSDHNRDGKMDGEDLKEISFYDLKTKKHTIIETGIKQVLSAETLKNGNIIVLYSKENKILVKSYNMNSGKVINTKKIKFPES